MTSTQIVHVQIDAQAKSRIYWLAHEPCRQVLGGNHTALKGELVCNENFTDLGQIFFRHFAKNCSDADYAQMSIGQHRISIKATEDERWDIIEHALDLALHQIFVGFELMYLQHGVTNGQTRFYRLQRPAELVEQLAFWREQVNSLPLADLNAPRVKRISKPPQPTGQP